MVCQAVGGGAGFTGRTYRDAKAATSVTLQLPLCEAAKYLSVIYRCADCAQAPLASCSTPSYRPLPFFFMSKRGDSTILAGRLRSSKDENHSLHPAPQSRALRPTIQMVRLHNRLKTNVV